jgi:antitoxin ParD1/3/4
MPSSYTLGAHFEKFIQAQLAGGRYNNASEVLRDALRMMEDRDKRRAEIDAAIEQSWQDYEAGRVHNADEVFSELRQKYEALAKNS